MSEMADSLSGISSQYQITARQINGLEELFALSDFHITKSKDKYYTEDYIKDIKNRMDCLISTPFSPNGLHDMTNSKKDGYSGWLPYSSYIQMSERREILCVYFESSFNKMPFIFMHFKPENGIVILSNYIDIEKLDKLRDDEMLEAYIDEIRIPNRIERMIAGVNELNRLSKMFTAIKNHYADRDSDIFEITCQYKGDEIEDDDIDPMLQDSDPRWQ